MKPNLALRLVAICMLIGTMAQAQMRLPGIIQRLELGYSFVNTSADYEGRFKLVDNMGVSRFAIGKGTVKPSAAAGVSVSTYVPLARLGGNSAFVLDINWLYNTMMWDQGIAGTTYDNAPGWAFAGQTVQMAFPVGFSFKFGADAVSNRGGTCASFGGGVSPTMNSNVFMAYTGSSIGVNPYIKAEAGFFAGICWKVRMIYSIGRTPLLDSVDKFGTIYDNIVSDFSFKANSTLTLSIIAMPFSWNWQRDGWWNRYRNSPKMYKGWRGRHKYNY